LSVSLCVFRAPLQWPVRSTPGLCIGLARGSRPASGQRPTARWHKLPISGTTSAGSGICGGASWYFFQVVIPPPWIAAQRSPAKPSGLTQEPSQTNRCGADPGDAGDHEPSGCLGYHSVKCAHNQTSFQCRHRLLASYRRIDEQLIARQQARNAHRSCCRTTAINHQEVIPLIVSTGEPNASDGTNACLPLLRKARTSSDSVSPSMLTTIRKDHEQRNKRLAAHGCMPMRMVSGMPSALG
jgi:hypothetical protein